MSQYQWKPRLRNYAQEKKETHYLRGVRIPNLDDGHPLAENKRKSVAVAPTRSASSSSVGSKKGDPLLDPLIAAAAPATPAVAAAPTEEFDDPLLAAARKRQREEEEAALAKTNVVNDRFIPWSGKKQHILQTYTTDERVGVQVSFMEPTQKAPVQVDKTKQRLEELEQLEQEESGEKKEVTQVTQQDYIKHIESLHSELIRAWEAGERVKSLKIVIQCSKLLLDTSVIKFYPSKFVIITEILDTFGRLVYERIYKRACQAENPGDTVRSLPANFTPDDVHAAARETCRNWFFKIASIRELLPRLYVEMSIMKCYSFLSHNAYPQVISRLMAMIRGLGHPLVAAYARCYLARRGHELLPGEKDYLLTGFSDFLFAHVALKKDEYFQHTLLPSHSVTYSEFCGLYTPAVEWLLQCLGHGADAFLLERVLRMYRESAFGLVLNSIIASFEPALVSQQALPLTVLIREADPDTFPREKLYRALGVHLALAAPSREHTLLILNDVWKVVTKLEDPLEYIAIAEVYIEYPLKHCSPREVNAMLGDILKHITKDNAYQKLQPQLLSIAMKILAHYNNMDVLGSMNKFPALLDLFQGEVQSEVNKALLEAFAKHGTSTSDPFLISLLFTAAKGLHDAVNTLTFADEVRQITRLLVGFVQKVDFGQNVEKQLDFYADCRRAFANLDGVKVHLVQQVCALAMRTLTLLRGRHNQRSAAFVRACIAYCFITIPSMDGVQARLQLYLLAAQVALLNQALPQADSLLKAAITLLPELPPLVDIDNQLVATEDDLVAYVTAFAATLVVVPGSPESGPFYLVKGLMRVLQDYPWEKGSPGKARCMLALLQLFAVYAQAEYPYRLANVDSNDVLYARDPEYLTELQALIDKAVEDVLAKLADLKEDPDVGAKPKLVDLALDLFAATAVLSDLNPKCAVLAANLYALAKSAGADRSTLATALRPLAARKDGLANELLKKLASA